MALPKKKKIDPFNHTVGKERQQELIDLISDKSIYFPKSMFLEDLDQGIMDFTSNQLKVTVEGNDVPVLFLTKERWANLTLTWQYSDDNGNITMPFITVRRSEPPKQGTNESIKYRIAQNKKFTYTRVPTFENGVFGTDIYRIPQPVPIDMTYEISIFTHFLEDLNLFNETIQYSFASGQAYVNINGYYVPMMLNDVSDESNMDDFEGHKFYSQTATIVMQGFLQDDKNYEIIKSLRRVVFKLKEE